MKNRRICSAHAIPEASLSARTSADQKIGRKPQSATLLDRSAALLNSYSVLLKQTVYHFGDADAYFKKTLRNYSDFDLPNIRRKKSRVRTEERRPKPQLGQGDFSKSKLNFGSSEVSLKLARKEDDDEEQEVFYSPKSEVREAELEMEEDAPAEQPEGDQPEDPLKESEELVKQTSKDLDKIEDDLGGPKDDKTILKEVEECQAQCMEISMILGELKTRVHELLSKTERTPQEDQELEAKQKLLNEKMSLLEQKTRRIELLVGKTKKPDFDKPYDEDSLPKVVVCGLAENNMPKFIICDDKKRRASARKTPCSPMLGMSPQCPMARPPCPGPPCPGQQQQPQFAGTITQSQPPCSYPPCAPLPPPGMSVMPQFAKKLSDSYDMQERLAQENADLEGKRYKLQEDLLNKDQTVESLQRQLTSLQSELRMVVKENGLLNSKLQECSPTCPPPPPCPRSPRSCPPCPPFPCPPPGFPCGPCMPCRPCGDKEQKMPCGKGRGGVCPAEEEEKEKKKLEKQLNDMESEVRAIQNELSTVRQERIHLEQHRRMLSPMTAPPTCPAACVPCPRADNTQLKELREQYNTLQDDYKSKMVEVSGLRADVDKLKATAQEALESKKAVDERVKELERILKDSKNLEMKSQTTKEQLTELEQQITVAKQRFREAQDELEELRALTEDQQGQVGEYRNKYLEAQQQVEEQRRQIDLMELENNRIGEQVNLEMQRVKNQFQEKLQELMPLPDILKATQMKLQEAQQMHLMAERNNEALLREIQALRDKAAMIADEVDRTRNSQASGDIEKQSLIEKNAELERQVEEMTEENEGMRNRLDELQEFADDADKRANEKLHEIAQLGAEVDSVREESARVVARTKDRCETIRRSMQNQIADLEKQLAQSRAQAKAAQKDRDDIRQKMQCQINNLNENFEDAQMRIRTLQGHVNFLKNSAAVYPSMEQMPTARN